MTKEKMKGELKLSYEVVLEDFDRKLYAVIWDDTLGLSEGYLPDKFVSRPKEVWCIVKNIRNDTLGYYKGLSMPQTFTYFQTNDSVVTLNFMIGLNILPEKFEKDTTGSHAYLQANLLPKEFEPIEINLKTDLSKKFVTELKER